MSPSTPQHGPNARGLIFRALSGRSGSDVSGRGGDLRSMLIGAFGTSPRDPSRPNTKAAAAGLGVTPRTVQRWLAGEGQERISQPRPATMRALQRASRQAASTRRGRAAAVGGVRARAAKRGLALRIRGNQGHDPAYRRRRTTQWNLHPAQAEGFLSAYEQGGENGALQWLSGHPELYGMDSWGFGDIQGFQIGDLGGSFQS